MIANNGISNTGVPTKNKRSRHRSRIHGDFGRDVDTVAFWSLAERGIAAEANVCCVAIAV